jgi:hypothetical protein
MEFLLDILSLMFIWGQQAKKTYNKSKEISRFTLAGPNIWQRDIFLVICVLGERERMAMKLVLSHFHTEEEVLNSNDIFYTST